jgi:hypothetical protein
LNKISRGKDAAILNKLSYIVLQSANVLKKGAKKSALFQHAFPRYLSS